jgi:hypothetical protein
MQAKGKWDAMSRALTQFKQREGHCNVFVKHIEYLDHGGANSTNSILGLVGIPTHFTGAWKTGCEESGAVRESGCQVDCKFSRRLDWNFDLLLVFKEREGHMRVPAKHQESGADNLGAWLANQRLLYRPGRLIGSAEVARGSRGCHVGKQKRPKFDHDA